MPSETKTDFDFTTEIQKLWEREPELKPEGLSCQNYKKLPWAVWGVNNAACFLIPRDAIALCGYKMVEWLENDVTSVRSKKEHKGYKITIYYTIRGPSDFVAPTKEQALILACNAVLDERNKEK